jgi:hypothetical protein
MKPTGPSVLLSNGPAADGADQVVNESAEYVPDEHAEELTDIAIERMESEGGSDGTAK